jgi:hypothetical protein
MLSLFLIKSNFHIQNYHSSEFFTLRASRSHHIDFVAAHSEYTTVNNPGSRFFYLGILWYNYRSVQTI